MPLSFIRAPYLVKKAYLQLLFTLSRVYNTPVGKESDNVFPRT